MGTMEHDDELRKFEAEGAPELPVAVSEGYVEHDGARIWYSSHGEGVAVILLHGGLGNAGNWGYQVPALTEKGYRAIVIDSRGHGRSTRDARAYSYELMASDVLAVMDALRIEKAALVGWGDGACVALTLARQAAARVAGVLSFSCNMDPSGTKEFHPTPIVQRCFARHAVDYRRLSATPEEFTAFVEAVRLMMRTQPNWTAQELGEVGVPVTIVHSAHDEFIRWEHADYLGRVIPGAWIVLLDGVGHFAPLQRPEEFNAAMLRFMRRMVDYGRYRSL